MQVSAPTLVSAIVLSLDTPAMQFNVKGYRDVPLIELYRLYFRCIVRPPPSWCEYSR
jgi:hypothetical protein